jgi:hypothetical protein
MPEKIHYLLFRDEAAAAAVEARFRDIGEVRIDADNDADGAYWLVAVTTTVESSPPGAQFEAVADELGGEYDGSETELG